MHSTTQRKSAGSPEAVAAEEQQVYSLPNAILNSSENVTIFSLDKKYCYTSFNESHQRNMKNVWGVDIKTGMNLLECLTIPELKKLARLSIDRALRGEVFSEVRFQPGVNFYYEFFWSPVYENKKVTGVTAFIINITERKLTEQALEQQKELLKKGEMFASFGSWRIDLNTQTVYASEGAQKIYGEQKEKITLTELKAYRLPEYDDLLDEAMMKLITENKPYDIEFKIKHKSDGKIIDVHSKAEYDAVTNTVFGTLQDITVRKQAQQAVLKTEAMYSSILTASPDGIVITDLNGRLQLVSQSALKIFRYQHALEVLGRELTDFVIPGDRERILANLAIMFEQHKSSSGEYIACCRDESLLPVEVHTSFIRNAAGEPTNLITIIRDITERKLAETGLASTTEQLKRTAAIAKVGGWEFNFETGKRLWSEETCRILEIDEAGLAAMGDGVNLSLYDPEILPVIKAALQAGLDEGTGFDLELPMITAKGKHIWIRHQGAFERVNGKTVKVEGFIQDITSRKHTETMLEESRIKFQGLSDAAYEAIFISEGGICLEQNNMAEKLFGYTAAEAVGRKGIEWIVPEDRETVTKHMHEGYEEPYEVNALRKDGTSFPCMIRGRQMKYKGRSVRVTSLSDITELKEREQQIARQQKFTEVLLFSIPTPVFYKDTACRYLGCNEAFSNQTGIQPEDLIGKTVTEIWPDEQAAIYHEKDLELLQNPGHQVYETTVPDKNGELRDVLFAKDVFYDEAGNIAGIMGAYIDITEKKREATLKQEAQDRLLKIAKSVPGLIYQFRLRPDGSSCIPYASEAIHEIYRLSPEDVREDASKVFANIHPDDVDNVIVSIKTSAKDLLPWQHEYRVKFEDGTIRFHYGNAIPQREEDGSVLWNGFVTDITAKKEVEQELLTTQLFNRHIINTIPVSVFWKDTNLVYQGCNELFANAGGFKDPRDIIGKNDFDMVWKSEAEKYQADDRYVLEHGCPKMLIEETQTTFDGKVMDVLTNKIPLRNADGEITGILGTFFDITERKRAEAREREIQERIIKIARQVPGVIYQFRMSFDGNASFLYVSDSLYDIFGIDPEEIYADARNAFSKVHPEDYAEFMASIKRSAEELSAWQYEFRVVLSDGKLRHLYGTSVPEQEADGSVLWHGFISDVTDHKFTEERIRQLSKAVDQSPVSIVITDTGGNIQYVNPKFVELTGYSFDEALGKNPNILKSGYTSKSEYKKLWKTITRGETWRGELQNKKKNGDLYWESATISPIFDEAGETTHYLAVKEDITERKEAEAEIERMAITLDIAPNAITVHDFDGNFRYANQRNFDIHGYSRAEFMNINLHQLDVPASAKLIAERMQGLSDSKEINFEAAHYRKDGTIVPLEIHARLIRWGSSDAVLSMATDITERLAAEQKMQELLKNYEFVNKATSDTIWEWDLKTNAISRNENFTKTFGYASGTVINFPQWAKKYIHPDDYERVKDIIECCIEHKLEHWQAEYRYCAADGSYRYVYDRAFILFDGDGNPSRMYGAMTDLTEKQNLKNALADQQLNQQKQLLEVNIQAHEEEKSELGKELHDNISQMLATVKMYLGLAKAGRSIPEFDLLGKSYDYVEETITELRKLSHSLVPPSLGEIGLQEALKDLIHIASLVKDKQVKLVVDKKIRKGEIEKKMELMIYRIVQEQLNNINKYASAKNVSIAIKKEKNCLLLTITDDGVGFDTANRSKGIGLRNMSNRVEYYSGTLDIISAPGAGCTIKAKIPFKFNTSAI